MKRIGLVGCGLIAELAHVEAIQSTPGLYLEAVYDKDFERGLYIQKKFNIPHCYPEEEAFFKSNLDAIVISTPPSIHYHDVLMAFENNKHVLCEKPLGINIEEIDHMIQKMKEKHLLLAVDFNYRFSPIACEIRKLIKEKAIGEIRSMRLIYIWNLHGKYFKTASGQICENLHRERYMRDYGPLLDCGIHQIDLSRWWLNAEPIWQYSIGIWIENYFYPDLIFLHMKMSNETHVCIEVSFSYHAVSKEPRSRFIYEIIGSEGAIYYDREQKLFEMRNSQETRLMEWHPEKNFKGLYTEFCRALHEGTPGSLPTAEEALIDTYIAKRATDEAIRKHHDFLSLSRHFVEDKILQFYRSNF